MKYNYYIESHDTSENYIHKRTLHQIDTEKISRDICERCGRAGKLRTDFTYMVILCDVCYNIINGNQGSKKM